MRRVWEVKTFIFMNAALEIPRVPLMQMSLTPGIFVPVQFYFQYWTSLQIKREREWDKSQSYILKTFQARSCYKLYLLYCERVFNYKISWNIRTENNLS